MTLWKLPRTADNGAAYVKKVEALYTNGPAGGGGVWVNVQEVVSIASIASILIPSEENKYHFYINIYRYFNWKFHFISILSIRSFTLSYIQISF